jgi:pyruvate,water dikinase
MTMVLRLHDEACQNPAISGGKAAALSRLAACYPVPPGFCVTADTSAAAIAEAYAALACETQQNLAVAIRSSALDEDGRAASFAGLYESYLNIRGAGNVIEMVLRCFESANAARIAIYRGARDNTQHPGMAVLVQQLIDADASAVVFSVNPVNNKHDEIIINANWGLGESIVAGTVTPDTYIVGKTDRRITAQIGAKTIMTCAAPNTDGTVERKLSAEMAAAPAMTARQILATAHLAQALERDCGFPVDVECAWREEKLYLLQCRAITTLEEDKHIS